MPPQDPRKSLHPRSSASTVALAWLAASAALLASPRASAQDLAHAEFFLGENGALQFTVMANGAPRSCNEVSFAAIPGDASHVIGRYNNGCGNQSFSLARYAIDWNARTLTLVNLAFDTSAGAVAISKGDSVTTAYDASVMSYGGELWVAFECGGDLAGCQTASSCVGPMDPNTGALDPSRTNVVVLGNNSLGDGYLYSASVPELLNFNGTPYIYWSAVKIDASNTSTWANITGRGMQLVEAGGQLWNAQLGSWVGSADPANTLEVWGLGASSADDAVADLQGVFTNGTEVFVTAGIAGSGCASPFWPPTCYTFAVSRSANPLAVDTFSNGTRLPASELPSNTHSYSRYIQDPDGQGYILGGYYTNAPGARPLPISGGPNAAYVTAYPIPSQSSYFQPLGGNRALSTSGTTMGNQDGRLEAFVVGTDQSLYHAWQASPGGSWSQWAELAPGSVKSPAVQRNADGRLEVFALGDGRDVVHVWQTSPGGAWSGLASLGGAANGGPAVDRNVDGSLSVFVVGTDGAVYHDQQAPGGWSGFVSLGGSAVGSPAVERNADGRLEVFAVGPGGALAHAWQVTPGGMWSAWASLGGNVASPIVQRNLDGRLEVFAVGAGGALFHTWQTAPGGAWNGAWLSLGGDATSPSVGRNADGRLEAFAVGDDLAVWHAWQLAPGGAWSGWASLGGNLHGASVQANADGSLELTAVAFGGDVQHDVQTKGGWSGWSSLGGAALPYAMSSSDDDKAALLAPPPDGGVDDGGSGGGDGGVETSGSGPSRSTGAAGAGGEGLGAGSGGGPASPGKTGSCQCGVVGSPGNVAPLWLLPAFAALLRCRRRKLPARCRVTSD